MGDTRLQGRLANAAGGLVGQKLEVRGFTPEDEAEADDGVIVSPCGGLAGGGGDFEGSRDLDNVYEAERGITRLQPASWALSFRSACKWLRKPMIGVRLSSCL